MGLYYCKIIKLKQVFLLEVIKQTTMHYLYCYPVNNIRKHYINRYCKYGLQRKYRHYKYKVELETSNTKL